MYDNLEISKRLKDVRKQLKLSQAQMADILGVSQGFYAGMESGRYTIKIEYIICITNKYDIDTNWFLTGEGEKYKKAAVSGTQDKPNLTKLPDIPIEKIKMWLDEFWRDATPREQAWLEVEFERMFPEYKAWLEKKEQKTDRKNTHPQSYNNTA